MSIVGRLALVGGVALAGGLAYYGIRARSDSVAALQATSDAAAIPSVEAVAPKRATGGDTVTLPGQVVAWNEAQIFGQVSGYVTSWSADYGATVKAGQTLATIDTPALDAEYGASRAQLAVAQARYRIAQLTADRFDKLKDGYAVTQQTIDDRNADADAAKAAMAQAQQNVDNYAAKIAFKTLVAPFAGVVTARRLNVGDFIDASGADATLRQGGQPLFTVDDVTKLRVFVSVPQIYGTAIRPNLDAELRLPGGALKTIPAKLLSRSAGVDRTTRTIVTEFVVDNPGQALMPGAFVDVALTFPSDPDVLLVPTQALIFRAGGMQVAVIGDGDRVRLQGVTLGRNLGLTVQITSGLTVADRIVANPSLGLLDGEQVAVVEPVPGYRPQADPPPARAPAAAGGPAVPVAAGPADDPRTAADAAEPAGTAQR